MHRHEGEGSEARPQYQQMECRKVLSYNESSSCRDIGFFLVRTEWRRVSRIQRYNNSFDITYLYMTSSMTCSFLGNSSEEQDKWIEVTGNSMSSVAGAPWERHSRLVPFAFIWLMSPHWFMTGSSKVPMHYFLKNIEVLERCKYDFIQNPETSKLCSNWINKDEWLSNLLLQLEIYGIKRRSRARKSSMKWEKRGSFTSKKENNFGFEGMIWSSCGCSEGVSWTDRKTDKRYHHRSADPRLLSLRNKIFIDPVARYFPSFFASLSTCYAFFLW